MAIVSGGGSSSSGGVTVVTTAAGLPATSSGAQALVRAGSTPFDFLTLIYDTTFAHWVSPVVTAHELVGQVNTTGTAYVDAGMSTDYAIPYAVFVTAGLTLQVRQFAQLAAGASSSIESTIITQGANNGAAVAAVDGTSTTGVVTWNTGTITGIDSGWANLNASVVSRDFMYFRFAVKRTGVNNGNINSRSYVWARWIV